LLTISQDNNIFTAFDELKLVSDEDYCLVFEVLLDAL